jgi:hypothetical protein
LMKYVSRLDVKVDERSGVKVFFHVHAGESEPQFQAINYPEVQTSKRPKPPKPDGWDDNGTVRVKIGRETYTVAEARTKIKRKS